DGMGGHSAGEVASYRAVTRFIKAVKKGVGSNVPEALRRIVLNINTSLIQEGKKEADRRGMGTTISALYFKGNMGYIAHVGDSRVYRYSNSGSNPSLERLEQLTEDHSLVAKLLKDGFISAEEAQNHPKRNVLYQSVGLKQGIEDQALGPFPIQKGQKFLLCSDGLNNEVGDKELTEFLELRSTHRIVEGLIKRAKTRTASDNISVIAVSTEKGETGEITRVEDTVKLGVPVRVRRRQRKKIVIFLLLCLLVLLLAAVVYLLMQDVKKEPDGVGNGTAYNERRGRDNGNGTFR
ncbi:MAG: serine/threonine-protein phosphatase, partial [bacterium]|nr:serine/threonine-protein phosphatase [bacterium]